MVNFVFICSYSKQNSGEYHLVKGNEYYVELMLRETHGGDHVGLRFYHPDTTKWHAMTSMYLKRSR